ncbi:multi subunit monovarent cation/proton antiporter MrpG subunit [Bacillus sp. TS-2]|nr:multi subunit monovarent cation/proton antiporter MrpG subunit [Bacillus sp. TS-2]
MSAIEWLIIILVILGGAFSVIASIGIIRLPDVYSRLHSTGKSSVTASILILLSTFLYFLYHHQLFLGKVLLGIAFIVITVPIAVFIIARTAYRSGTSLHKSSVRDELKPYYEQLKDVDNHKKQENNG